MLLSGADIIIKTLIEQGSDTVFGYPGGQILNVYDSLYKHKNEIKHILTAHEEGAAHAADGYARATGRPGVVIATSGPGATNLVTGIATAHLDSIPMIAITGNVSTSQIGYDSFQEIDITGITLPITKHNYFVDDVTKLADTIREAYRLSQSGRPGPVLIDVPKDVQAAFSEYEPAPKAVPDEKFSAKDVRIEDAAKFINSCKRPYIYFGGGIFPSGAAEEMLALADKIDAPLGCSLMGISGVPTNHPRFLGMQGMHGHYASSMAMNKADCIISLGVRFNDRVMGNKDKFANKAGIVHIDIDGSELSKSTSDTHRLRGDIKKTLEKLLGYIKKSKHPVWQKEIEELKQKESEFADRRCGMTPKNIIDILNEHLTSDTPVITDVGQHQMWAAQHLKFSSPRKFISSGGLGTMGFGLGASIGAQLATREHTVLITGDGSFGMSLTELATSVSNKIPLVILIFNNGVLGMVRQWQTTFFEKHYSSSELNRKTDFIAVAKAFGADGTCARNLTEFKDALKKAFKYDGTFVIDCLIEKDELVLPMLPPGGDINSIITHKGEFL